MQNATYRGVQYTVNNEATAPVDQTLCYRGVEHNPATQEVHSQDATLTYRGVEYVRLGNNALGLIREKSRKQALAAAARAAFTRNLSESAIV